MMVVGQNGAIWSEHLLHATKGVISSRLLVFSYRLRGVRLTEGAS